MGQFQPSQMPMHAPQTMPVQASMPAVGGVKPKKYIRSDGTMKLNPEYTKWQQMQGNTAEVTTLSTPTIAAPIAKDIIAILKQQDLIP